MKLISKKKFKLILCKIGLHRWEYKFGKIVKRHCIICNKEEQHHSDIYDGSYWK